MIKCGVDGVLFGTKLEGTFAEWILQRKADEMVIGKAVVYTYNVDNFVVVRVNDGDWGRDDTKFPLLVQEDTADVGAAHSR